MVCFMLAGVREKRRRGDIVACMRGTGVRVGEVVIGS